MSIAASLAALEVSAGQVTGLRTKLSAGKATPPAAVIELAQVVTPAVQGGSADYVARVSLLVQVGDFRNVLERIWALAEPDGSVSTSLTAALLSNDQVGQVTFEAGNVDYAGTTYGGGIFTVELYD